MRERSIDGLNQFFSGLDYCSVECWCLDINFNSILFHPLYAFFYFFCSAAQKQICVVGACPFAIEASSDPRCFLPLFRPSSNKSTLPYLWVLLSCFYSINNKITQSVIQTLEVYCVGPLLYISSSRYSSGCPLPAALSCNKTFDGCSCLGFTRVSTAAQVGRYYLALLLDESNQYAIRHYPSSSGIFIRCMPP